MKILLSFSLFFISTFWFKITLIFTVSQYSVVPKPSLLEGSESTVECHHSGKSATIRESRIVADFLELWRTFPNVLEGSESTVECHKTTFLIFSKAPMICLIIEVSRHGRMAAALLSDHGISRTMARD